MLTIYLITKRWSAESLSRHLSQVYGIPRTTSKTMQIVWRRRSCAFVVRSSRLLHSAAVSGSPVRSRPRSQCLGPSGCNGCRDIRSRYAGELKVKAVGLLCSWTFVSESIRFIGIVGCSSDSEVKSLLCRSSAVIKYR